MYQINQRDVLHRNIVQLFNIMKIYFYSHHQLKQIVENMHQIIEDLFQIIMYSFKYVLQILQSHYQVHNYMFYPKIYQLHLVMN